MNSSDEHSKKQEEPQTHEEPEPISTEERQPFVNSLLNLIDQNKIDGIIDTQRHMMARFEKTNEMLVNCNALSLSRYEIAMKEVKRMSQNLGEMKKDLDYIFKRVKFIRTKYNQQHPEAFKSLMNKGNQLDEEEDEES
ncbi:kxDL motif-containing protein CG10681-like [Tetranychus urticae]|uniref:KxDL domain-containing protein n=1 Tax=Tetranychus urticae TaxID=32264 RepID=T1K781_TETUR|nr:kxDL motif-containing protein CG10681-like [Tetranychus urticae]